MLPQDIAKTFPKRIPLEIKGVELRFVEPTFENAKLALDVIVANKSHLLPWLMWADKIKTLEDSFRFLDNFAKNWKSGSGFEFGIFVDESFYGMSSVHSVSMDDESGSIGYWLSKDQTGKGLVSAVVRAIEKECFLNYNFHRLVISCNKENIASVNVARRCGYTQEAELREDAFDKIRKVFFTHLKFSKLRNEYKP